MQNTVNFSEISYKELVAQAAEAGMEKAHQQKKESLIEFLTGLQAKMQEEPKKKREKKQHDPRILEMAGGQYTRREIAKAIGCSYSDVYFALKAAGLDAKPAKKVKDLADAAAEE